MSLPKLATATKQKMKQRLRLHKFGAFTLIELLVVIAIIAILAACCSPRWPRPRPRPTASSASITSKQIGLAFKIFAGDNDDRFRGHERRVLSDVREQRGGDYRPNELFRLPGDVERVADGQDSPVSG